jgi:hypothetical protein
MFAGRHQTRLKLMLSLGSWETYKSQQNIKCLLRYNFILMS